MTQNYLALCFATFCHNEVSIAVCRQISLTLLNSEVDSCRKEEMEYELIC